MKGNKEGVVKRGIRKVMRMCVVEPKIRKWIAMPSADKVPRIWRMKSTGRHLQTLVWEYVIKLE